MEAKDEQHQKKVIEKDQVDESLQNEDILELLPLFVLFVVVEVGDGHEVQDADHQQNTARVVASVPKHNKSHQVGPLEGGTALAVLPATPRLVEIGAQLLDVLIDLANGVDGEFTTGLQGELVGIFIF
jgi:hypothetical protein